MTQPEANIVKCFQKQQILLSIPEPGIALDYRVTYWWVSSLISINMRKSVLTMSVG